MPQHRKVPFSGKKKKVQLQEKRERRRHTENEDSSVQTVCKGHPSVRVIQPQKAHGIENINRFALNFIAETKEEILQRKQMAQINVIQSLDEIELEFDLNNIHSISKELAFPRRPKWNFSMSKESVLHREKEMFKVYVNDVVENYSNDKLSYFETNIETWRQFWRVIEMSDILLIIADIRFACLHFSPHLYEYLTKDLNKSVVFILNKVDLVSPSVSIAWKHYFQKAYPDVDIVLFTSYPLMFNIKTSSGRKTVKKSSEIISIGLQDILDACSKIVRDKGIDANIGEWRTELEKPEEFRSFYHVKNEKSSKAYFTIGCIGQPNVGKSTIMNTLIGRKVVSTSKTPGHTKHFQTYFLTENMRLCDCPGLVFPLLLPKQFQILCGLFPIAQVKEPYSVVGYLSARTNLVEQLNLHLTEGEYTAWEICDAWAEKRGFKIARTSRNDVYRAANHILRLTLDGKISIYFRPPSYNLDLDLYESHEETKNLLESLLKFNVDNVKLTDADFTDESETSSEQQYSESSEFDNIEIKNKFALPETEFDS